METISSSQDTLVKKMVSSVAKQTRFERYLRRQLFKIIFCFKSQFMNSIQWAPASTDERQTFPFDANEKNYEKSVLKNERIQSSTFWNTHIKKIEEYFNELESIAYFNPISIPVYTLTATFIVYCLCTQAFVFFYFLSIYQYTHKKIKGEVYWAVWIPIYAQVNQISCRITYYIVMRNLKRKIEARASEMYLLTFYYNTSYFSDFDLYIHIGVYSSWIDIGPILDTDFVGKNTFDSDLMQKSLCFNYDLYDQVKTGKFLNENTELGKQQRHEIYKAVRSLIKAKEFDTQKLYMESMTASYFFPTTNHDRLTKGKVLHSSGQNNCGTDDQRNKAREFLKEHVDLNKLKSEKVLKLFNHYINNPKVQKKVKKPSGEGVPVEYCPNKAKNIFESYICAEDHKKTETFDKVPKKGLIRAKTSQNQITAEKSHNPMIAETSQSNSMLFKSIKRQSTGKKIKSAFGNFLTKLGVIKEDTNEKSSTENSGIEENTNNKDVEMGNSTPSSRDEPTKEIIITHKIGNKM